MARRKRPYVPKVKGCYQCSQRRIDCDGTRPSCQKCSSRGLACSGFGRHYKFLSGFQPRVRKQRKVNSCDELHGKPATLSSASAKARPEKLITTEDAPKEETGQWALTSIEYEGSVRDSTASALLQHLMLMPLELDDISSINVEANNKSFLQPTPNVLGSNGDIVDDEINGILSSFSSHQDTLELDSFASIIGIEPNQRGGLIQHIHESEHEVRDTNLVLSSGLAWIEPWRGSLLKYFSDFIAPEMVVIDDCHNGWRNLILPIASTDELVSNAVLSVSAFHLSGRAVAGVADPTSLSVQAINELQKRSNLDDCDSTTKQSVIIAIVLLLVGSMVNGGSDFPTVFYMLEHALDAIGGQVGLESNDVSKFLARQIHKLRVYAAPFISQTVGVITIQSEAKQSFDCLNYYRRLYPEHTRAFSVIANLRQQAYDIYLRRVTGVDDSVPLRDPIDHFKVDLESLSAGEGSYGEHVLIWASFIAASESREKDHRDFFRNFLERQYRRNGFGNLVKALELLERIWERKPYESWPALLPEPGVFIM